MAAVAVAFAAAKCILFACVLGLCSRAEDIWV